MKFLFILILILSIGLSSAAGAANGMFYDSINLIEDDGAIQSYIEKIGKETGAIVMVLLEDSLKTDYNTWSLETGKRLQLGIDGNPKKNILIGYFREDGLIRIVGNKDSVIDDALKDEIGAALKVAIDSKSDEKFLEALVILGNGLGLKNSQPEKKAQASENCFEIPVPSGSKNFEIKVSDYVEDAKSENCIIIDGIKLRGDINIVKINKKEGDEIFGSTSDDISYVFSVEDSSLNKFRIAFDFDDGPRVFSFNSGKLIVDKGRYNIFAYGRGIDGSGGLEFSKKRMVTDYYYFISDMKNFLDGGGYKFEDAIITYNDNGEIVKIECQDYYGFDLSDGRKINAVSTSDKTKVELEHMTTFHFEKSKSIQGFLSDINNLDGNHIFFPNSNEFVIKGMGSVSIKGDGKDDLESKFTSNSFENVIFTDEKGDIYIKSTDGKSKIKAHSSHEFKVLVSGGGINHHHISYDYNGKGDKIKAVSSSNDLFALSENENENFNIIGGSKINIYYGKDGVIKIGDGQVISGDLEYTPLVEGMSFYAIDRDSNLVSDGYVNLGTLNTKVDIPVIKTKVGCCTVVVSIDKERLNNIETYDNIRHRPMTSEEITMEILRSNGLRMDVSMADTTKLAFALKVSFGLKSNIIGNTLDIIGARDALSSDKYEEVKNVAVKGIRHDSTISIIRSGDGTGIFRVDDQEVVISSTDMRKLISGLPFGVKKVISRAAEPAIEEYFPKERRGSPEMEDMD